MMSDPIDINAERTKRAQPDAEFRSTDEYGRPYFKFTAEYRFDGRDYAIDFWALDEAEAKARVEAMRGGLQYEGQLFSSRPA